MTERVRDWICMSLGWSVGLMLFFFGSFDGWLRLVVCFTLAFVTTALARLISKL